MTEALKKIRRMGYKNLLTARLGCSIILRNCSSLKGCLVKEAVWLMADSYITYDLRIRKTGGF